MEDEAGADVAGAKSVRAALRDDPIAALLGARLANPYVAGIVIALLIVAMVLLGPSSGSRFIYTDF